MARVNSSGEPAFRSFTSSDDCGRPATQMIREGTAAPVPADLRVRRHRYDCLMTARRDIDRMKTEMEELFADLCQVPATRCAPGRLSALRSTSIAPTTRRRSPSSWSSRGHRLRTRSTPQSWTASSSCAGAARAADEHRAYQHIEIDYGILRATACS